MHGEDYFRLRAEWLRFKNQVFDADTDLPTFTGVLDAVRRLQEDRTTLGLVYLDLGAEMQIELLHGWQAYDTVVQAFAKALEALRGEGLLGPRDIVAAMGVRSDKFIVFLSGPEGAALDGTLVAERAAAIRARLMEALPPLMPSGNVPLGFHVGYAVMRHEPMLRAERSVQKALDEAMYMSLRLKSREEDTRLRGLDEVLGGEQLVALYQPILYLDTLEVLGHEVFTHGPAGGPFEEAELLFALAERTGRLNQLERLCRGLALGSARSHLKRGGKLFLNTSARTLRDPDVAGAGFIEQVESHGFDHGDVVLEITERVAFDERQTYREALRRLKHEGFGLAIDDMGAGHASLQALVDVEPDYLKFDISLVRHIDRNVIKRSLLETLVELAAKIGARVIAEGIEVESEMKTVRDMGVPLGQGMFLGPPLMVEPEATAS